MIGIEGQYELHLLFEITYIYCNGVIKDDSTGST